MRTREQTMAELWRLTPLDGDGLSLKRLGWSYLRYLPDEELEQICAELSGDIEADRPLDNG